MDVETLRFVNAAEGPAGRFAELEMARSDRLWAMAKRGGRERASGRRPRVRLLGLLAYFSPR
jgi:hypothetical protein